MELDQLIATYGVAAAAVLAYMVAWFALATVLRNNGIVDIAWGLGFIVIALTTMSYNESLSTPQGALVTMLVLAWGLRLAVHIFIRGRGAGEDWRYKQWREDWGRTWIWRSFLQVYLLQGFFMLGIAGAIITVAANPDGTITWLHWLGAAVAAAGLIVEAVGDAQLQSFIKHRKSADNRFITTGLWRYTRHPNYFGDAVFWWGLAMIAISVPYGWLGIVSAVWITWSLRFLSGVPLLEKKFAGHPDWEAYAAATPVFIPGPVKTRSTD